MLKIDGWLFATLFLRAHVIICNNISTDNSSSTLTTSNTSTTTETKATSTSTNTISTDDLKGTSTLCTTAGTTNTALTERIIISIGSIAVVAVVVLVAACYYRRRRSRKRTKAGKDHRFSYRNNIRVSVRNTDNLNVIPSLEWDNQMPKPMHSDANAVYASVQRMQPSQSITQGNNRINTMERMPDSTYNQTSELLDDTYDSTITCGKITLDDTYDHTNFKTSYYSTCDTYGNTSYTHDNIYDPDAQQTMNDFEPTYDFTLNNVNGETTDEPFQHPKENVDDIYNNMTCSIESQKQNMRLSHCHRSMSSHPHNLCEYGHGYLYFVF